jgi:hypothetical protein
MGRFGAGLAFLATQPEPIEFENFLPAILNESTKTAKYSGRTGRVAQAGRARRVKYSYSPKWLIWYKKVFASDDQMGLLPYFCNKKVFQ